LLKTIQDFLIDTSSKIVDDLYTDKLMAITHNDFFRKYLHNLSKIFVKHKWIIGVNQTDIPFYTSDHPVAKIPYFGSSHLRSAVLDNSVTPTALFLYEFLL